MEEFLELNWKWNTNRTTTSSLYAGKFGDDEKDVFWCHINEIDHIHLLDDYGKNVSSSEPVFVRKDPRTGQEVINEVLDHRTFRKTLLYSNFPQRSSMNSNQHQSCLNAIAKLRNDASNAPMSDRNDIRTYAQLSIERNKEKTHFLEFVKGEFYKRNIKNCYSLLPELNKFISKRWKDSIENVMASNSQSYQLQTAIPISQGSGNDVITMEHVKTIEETGTVLVVNSKKYSNPVQVSCKYLEYFFANDADITAPLEQQITSHAVDAVISLKTLTKILISARDLSTDWNTTFTVKQYGNKNVIIFDEILPSSSFSCLEKNTLAFKYGVKATIVVPKKKEVFRFEENRFVERIQPTFDERSSSNLLESPVSDYKVRSFEEYASNKVNDSISTNNATADSNHIRRLWKLGRNNIDDCRLVVDSKQDFCEKRTDGSVIFINLSPKIEYQCEFGAEQMSLPELIAEWCELRFGPNTITHRVRIEAISGCVIEMKEVTIADVEHDLRRLYQVKAEMLLDPFVNFVEIIKRFPSNDYMLRHLQKHNTQAMVYVKSNEISTNTIRLADIYKSYRVDTSNVETIPWNPIDDTVCTTIHKRSGVMPCAFPHWENGRNVNKRKGQSNDRSRLVERAMQKDQEKEAAIATNAKKAKALKKQKPKPKKKKATAERAKLLKFEGESLDPSELFDERGNIDILGLASHNHGEENNQPKEENDQPKVDSHSSESMSFETYCRDAALLSNDSID